MKVRINRDDMMKISLFEKITEADVLDCISDDERIVFIVKEGDIGAAIGKGGENVKTAMEKFNKKIDVIEYSSDIKKFVRNIFEPLKLEDVWLKKFNGKLVVYVRVHPKLRRAIIGINGKNIDRAVNILSRLSDAKNIKVISEPRRELRRGPGGRYRGKPRKFDKKPVKKPTSEDNIKTGDKNNGDETLKGESLDNISENEKDNK